MSDVELISNPKETFWKLATPLLLLSIFGAAYSFVDVFWVSQMDSESFFAIGIAVPLVTLIMGFGKSLGVGTNSLISRELGEGDIDGTYNSILHGIVACFVLGCAIMLSSLFLPNILIFIGATSSMDLSMEYLTPIFLCPFVFLFSNLFVSTMQAEGNSRTPTAILIFSNILNLVLDPIFIFVFNWGVAGVSYATILSSLVTTLYLLYWYLSGKTRVILNFKYFKPGILYQIFIVAIPNFLTDSLWCILGLFFNKVLIQQLSQIGVLLYSTGSRIQSLMVSPQKALGRALLTVSGHLYGAKKFDELKWMYTYVIKISVSIALISSVVFFFIRDYGFALFSVSGAETSVFYIALAAIILIPVSEISEMSEKVLDGMGKSYYALVLTVGVILYEILLVSLLKPIFTSGVCVLLGILIGEITSAIVYYALFKYLSKTHGEGIKPHIIRGYSFKNQNV